MTPNPDAGGSDWLDGGADPLTLRREMAYNYLTCQGDAPGFPFVRTVHAATHNRIDNVCLERTRRLIPAHPDREFGLTACAFCV